jgi:hypothetical protein
MVGLLQHPRSGGLPREPKPPNLRLHPGDADLGTLHMAPKERVQALDISRRRLLRGVALAGVAQFAGVAKAAEAVDVALVMAADVSRSINDDEFALQRGGYAAAITSPRLLDAIHSGVHGAIVVTFVEWAGEAEQKTVIDWQVLRDEADAHKFAAALLDTPRSFVGRTAIGTAIDFAAGLLGESGFVADRLLIDVSGDGTNNQGRLVTDARDAVVKAGIVINGLAIFNRRAAAQGGALALHTNPPGGILKYYQDNVIGGAGSFALMIDDFNSFGDAMIRKLVAEIAGTRLQGPAENSIS